MGETVASEAPTETVASEAPTKIITSQPLQKFHLGDRIEANYQDLGKWYPAEFLGRSPTPGFEYSVRYDDQDSQTLPVRTKREHVRRPQPRLWHEEAKQHCRNALARIPTESTPATEIREAVLPRCRAALAGDHELEPLETILKTDDSSKFVEHAQYASANVAAMMAKATQRVMHPNISYGWWIIALILLFFALVETDQFGDSISQRVGCQCGRCHAWDPYLECFNQVS